MIKEIKILSSAELLAKLASREREVFDLIVSGKRTKEIGDQLNIKANTVSTIKKVIFRKLKVSTNIELFKIAQECQLV
jgi:two-component system invasion response regulator UvrY